MGDTFSSEKELSFLQKIEYFQPAEDPNYGKLQIYRMRDPPYEYVLDHRKTFIEDQDRMTQYITTSARMKELQHKNIAKVHACIVKEDKQLCIIHRVVHTYCSYYNFTLAQAIAKKKATKNAFSEGDLLYMMHAMVDVVCYLKGNELVFGQFRTESVYLSPEGHLKLYLLEIDPQNRHTAYYRVLGEHAKMIEYILSPQQLQSIRKMDYQVRFSHSKADLFAIGMVMLQLLTLDSAKFYFNEQKMEVMISKALFSLEIYSARYSKELIEVIKACLASNPLQRPEPEDVLSCLEELRNNGKSNVYCIRLQAQENKEKREEGVPKPKGQYILNSLAKKLNPSPISTISSSSASLYRTTAQGKSSSFRVKSSIPFFKE